MFKKIGFVLLSALIIGNSIAIRPAYATQEERRIVYTNGLDGHVVSIAPDGSNRRDYGPGSFAKLSPDGTHIAFVRDGTDATRDLYVADIDGGNLRKVSERVHTLGSPAYYFSWSPDGSKIVHTIEYGASPDVIGGEHKQLAIVNVNSAERVQITHEPANTWNVNPSWSPDGSRILYTRITSISELYMVNTDGSNAHLITPHASDGSWSPDAANIVFSESGVGVRTARADGSNPVTLAVVGQYATWSPDGSFIVLESPECDCSQSPSAIVAVRPDGTDKKIVAKPPTAGGVGQPAWSPDSTKVIFNEWARWESPRLVVKSVQGGDGSVVVNEPAGYPQWAYAAYTPPPSQPKEWHFSFNGEFTVRAYIYGWVEWWKH
jgi:Tol biopolymer transport system component